MHQKLQSLGSWGCRNQNTEIGQKPWLFCLSVLKQCKAESSPNLGRASKPSPVQQDLVLQNLYSYQGQVRLVVRALVRWRGNALNWFLQQSATLSSGYPDSAQIKPTMLKIHFFFISIFALTSRSEVPVESPDHLHNQHFKVAAVPFSPFIMFYCNEKEIENTEECPDKGDLTFGGALWDFLKVVKILRNVTFSIVNPPTPTWGICHEVNNCTGMIGMVNWREVDFALGTYHIDNHILINNKNSSYEWII